MHDSDVYESFHIYCGYTVEITVLGTRVQALGRGQPDHIVKIC